MANNLTGDFDVVAEFALPAINRILAAMHQCERFLHSVSSYIDDNPHPGTNPVGPTMGGVVDAFGDAVVDRRLIGRTVSITGGSLASDPNGARLGIVINPGLLNVGTTLVPSHIQGSVQVQLAPPSVEVSGANLTARINVIVRFFPDKGTAPLAEFMRGDVTITAPISKVASGKVHVLDIDFKADEAVINFTPSYSSSSLSPEDLAGINLCIQNGLRTSFLPSSVILPSSIADIQLKTLPGAVAILLDLNDHPSTPGSVNQVFLGSGDDFAFAVGRDMIMSVFNSSISSLTQFQPFGVSQWPLGSTTYTITLTATPTLSLQTGAIVLTVQAHAHSSSGSFPSFNFTTTISFSLNLVPTGEGGLNAAELALAGVSLDFSNSGLTGWLKDALLGLFSGPISNQIGAQVNAILSSSVGLQATIRQMTDADANLGDYLTAQMVPSDGSSQTPGQHVFLMYTSFDISPDGIVLHGSVMVFDFPSPYVEFEQVPSQSNSPVRPIFSGPEYSALKSWIPGGTIQQYEWSYQGQSAPFRVDPNTFVLVTGTTANAVALVSSGAVPAYTPLCLTVRGTRINNFGTAVQQAVSGKVCGATVFPVGVTNPVGATGAATAMFAVTQPGPGGLVTMTGHAAPLAAAKGSNAPNLLVHFADAKSAGQLDVLVDSVNQSKRDNAATAVIAVVSSEQISKLRYNAGIAYADDRNGSWENALGLKTSARPLTIIVNPKGVVVWQQQGVPDRDTLAGALSKNLQATGPIPITMPRLNVRIGQPAPRFLFEISPGCDVPLTKLRGQPITLVFWRSSSRPSIDAVKSLSSDPASLVLAINDGEASDVARSAAAESGFTATLVTDPERQISSAYGVSIWPTIVSLDSSGTVTSIRYGYSGNNAAPAAGSAA